MARWRIGAPANNTLGRRLVFYQFDVHRRPPTVVLTDREANSLALNRHHQATFSEDRCMDVEIMVTHVRLDEPKPPGRMEPFNSAFWHSLSLTGGHGALRLHDEASR
jgi:hypothetical protein